MSHASTRALHRPARPALLCVVSGLLALTLTACASMSGPAPLSAERIKAIIASPDRTAADRTNDLRRKPEALLGFIGIQPGMTALDVSAAGGYTTELLARSIGPSGVVYGQNPPRNPAATPPAQPEGNSNPNLAAAPAAPVRQTLADRARLLQGVANAARVVVVQQPFDNPVPPEAVGKLDLVTLMFNYHDFGHMGINRAALNAAVFRALKPGGMYVLADHSGRPGTGISEAGTLHRIEEAFLRREIEAAGFRLAESGDFLRNPNDPRDRNTPNPPQPKDEFVLKFVKP